MEFLAECTWWSLLGLSLIAAIAPACFRKIRFSALAGCALFCLAMISAMYLFNGTAAAVTGAVVTLGSSVLTLAGSMILGGIGDMLKKRYR